TRYRQLTPTCPRPTNPRGSISPNKRSAPLTRHYNTARSTALVAETDRHEQIAVVIFNLALQRSLLRHHGRLHGLSKRQPYKISIHRTQAIEKELRIKRGRDRFTN